MATQAISGDPYLRDIWWMFLLRGIAGIIFGFMAIAWPGITLLVLAFLLSLWLLVVGVIDIIQGIGAIGKRSLWFLTILMGVLELVVGVYLLQNRTLRLETFVVLAALVFIFKGILEIVAAFGDVADSGMKFLLIIGGVIGILAGLVLLRDPAVSLAFVWVFGVFAIITGTMTIAAALSLKNAIK